MLQRSKTVIYDICCKVFIKTRVKHQSEEDSKQTNILSGGDGAETVQQWKGNAVGSSSGGDVNYKEKCD